MMYLKDYSTKVRANLNDVMCDIQQLQNQGCNETHLSVVNLRFFIQMYLYYLSKGKACLQSTFEKYKGWRRYWKLSRIDIVNVTYQIE